MAHVARLFADAGAVALVSLVSPFREDRRRARRLHEAAGLPFVEVFVDTPVEECARRDPKGLYARARAGRLTGLTGANAPYEPPEAAEIVIRGEAVEDSAAAGAGVADVVSAACSSGNSGDSGYASPRSRSGRG